MINIYSVFCQIKLLSDLNINKYPYEEGENLYLVILIRSIFKLLYTKAKRVYYQL